MNQMELKMSNKPSSGESQLARATEITANEMCQNDEIFAIATILKVVEVLDTLSQQRVMTFVNHRIQAKSE